MLRNKKQIILMALFLAAAAATETEDRKMLIPMVVVKDEPQGRKNSRTAAIFLSQRRRPLFCGCDPGMAMPEKMTLWTILFHGLLF